MSCIEKIHSQIKLNLRPTNDVECRSVEDGFIQNASNKIKMYAKIELKKMKEGENKSQIEVSEKGRNIQTFVKKEVYIALVEEKTELKYELETKKKEANKAISELQKIKESGQYIDSNDNTKNEIDSLKRQLDETKKELQTMKEEKSEQNYLREEMVAKDVRIIELEDSKAKLQKLKQLLATTIFLANAKGENLESLLKLEIEDLFSKYDQSIIVKNSYKDKYEETIETLSEVKIKLQLQMQQKELYEKQHNEMMDILNIPEENRGFASILPAIQHLKSSLSVIQEQAETNHYTNAQTQIGSIL